MGTMVNKGDIYRDIEATFGSVPQWVREVPEQALSGFWSLQRDFYMAETKIPSKYKELIGIAVSGATRCRYCVLFHTEGARLQGATDEEIAEASMMAGVTMMASTFLNAQGTDFDLFRKETLDIVSYVRNQMASAPKGAASPRVSAH